jgi:hypothetical protein
VEGDAHLAEYTKSLKSFLAEWSEATISLRITALDRRSQALATRAWRRSVRGQHTKYIAVSAQHALVGDFAAARRVLDDALVDLRQRPAVSVQEPIELLIRSKRAEIDALEETWKPLALRSLTKASRAYLTAARICRRPGEARSGRDPLELRLRAYRALYLSHAFSWSASAILRAGEKETTSSANRVVSRRLALRACFQTS